jgi:5-methylcytosine-specific restriction protein A
MPASDRTALLELPQSAIDAAIREYDQLGEASFLARHGYRAAERWVLAREGKHYPPRAILAAAFRAQHGKQLRPREGPRGLTEKQLTEAFKRFGFTLEDQQGRSFTSPSARATRHWTLCVDPTRYNVEQSLRRRSEEWWCVKKSDVRNGDLVAIWQTRGNGDRRGIVALGEVASSPEVRADDSPYWLNAEGHRPERRALVRYTDVLDSPLWLDEHEDVLGALAAAKARGGTVFKMTTAEWERVTRLAESDRAGDETKAPTPSEGGSGRSPRNPPWSRDELILALDLYFRHSPRSINQDHPEVHKLSELLNALPLQPTRPDSRRFRNANGVYMKLCNFLRFDPGYTGKGLTRGARGEEQVWNDFAGDPVRLHELAKAIELGHRSVAVVSDDDSEADDGEGFVEGRIMERLHRARERSSKLRALAKMRALSLHGRLACLACGFDFAAVYGAIGDGFIECHHTRPVSELAPGAITRVEDLALLCANCHRMVHRRRPWLDLDGLAKLVNRP